MITYSIIKKVTGTKSAEKWKYVRTLNADLDTAAADNAVELELIKYLINLNSPYKYKLLRDSEEIFHVIN